MGGYMAKLDDVKLIKNVAGATVNDVVLGIVGGALRRYFEAKNELPDESLVAIVPISTRSEENLSTDGGNEVAGIRVRLGTHIADPLERIQAIHAEALRSKAYANAVGADLMVNAIHSVPATLAALGSRAASSANLTAKKIISHTGVTNVPGTPYPLYMLGAKIVRMFGPGVITDGMGLFHCVSSYNGEVTITFLSCRDMLPDPEFYHKCLSNEYKALLRSAKKAAQSKQK
jgi:WS/DGAT/MGAT family acyltransferase